MARNPPGYFCVETERYTCCDGHWKCFCPEEDPMIIAGIGSRETPETILFHMGYIGAWCADHGTWVRSGHAEGADYAFEKGAQDFCITYEPWRNFNDGKLERTRARVCIPEDAEWMRELVRKYHPAPDKLSDGAMKLMMRNGCQIFGLLGPNDPDAILRMSRAVVCWTSDGEASGGTGQAIRIAVDHKIPVLNMQRSEWNDHLKVQDQLRRILGL